MATMLLVAMTTTTTTRRNNISLILDNAHSYDGSWRLSCEGRKWGEEARLS
jgi:hypothetical protein